MSVWKAIQDKTDSPKWRRSDEPTSILIWRHGLETRYRSLGSDEAAALTAALKGEKFSTLCEVLLEFLSPDQVAQRAAILLKMWLNDGLVTELKSDLS